jgi:hypothetical protein
MLYRSQVDEIAKRDGLEPASAEALAIQTLQLVAARRDELGPDAELPAGREAHLRSTALVRTYLRDVFEPENGPERMSDAFLAEQIAPPQRAARHFHPRLHKLCQVLAMPKQSGEKDAKHIYPDKDDAQWWADAHALIDPIAARLRVWESDFAGEERCDLIIRASKLGRRASEDGGIIIKNEGGMFQIDRADLWSQDWIDEISKAEGLGWVGPFETKFGIHFVYVLEIMPDTLIAPQDAKPEERIAAESEVFREKGLTQWRATEAFPNHIRDLRERHLVRLAGPGSDQPQDPAQ